MMRGARIMIVEDEGIVALDIQQRLENMGYVVGDIVSNGEDAIQKARESCPDLVLMDIMLGGEIDGITAAELIRSNFDIPVIFLTAYADEVTLQRAKITEPYGYIVKPFKEKELHITIDIALYKHDMERKLKESKKWFETTLRSIGDAVIATDKTGLITFINPVAETLIGWTLEEAVSRKLTDIFNIVNKDSHKPVENPAAKVLVDGVTRGLANHTILIASDGTETPIDDSAAPIKDNKGNISGVILVFRDITEREKSEHEREITIEFLRQVNGSTSSSDLARMALNFFQQQTGCQAAGIRLKEGEDYPYFESRGFSKDFLLTEGSICARDISGQIFRDEAGIPFMECLCGNVICGCFNPMKPFFTTKGSFWTNNMTKQLAGASEADLMTRTRNRCSCEGYESVALIPLVVGKERLGLMHLCDRREGMFSAETISLWERLADYLAVALAKFRAEEALRESEERYRMIAKELHEAGHRKDEFLAVLSHELRNPLASIRNSLQILDRAVPGGDQAKWAQGIIDRQTRQLARLVDDLLDITRITRNKIELKRKVLDLNELVRRTIEDHRILFEKNGIRLDVWFAPYAVMVNADEARMMQVIGNLLHNAAKFTHKGGSAKISVEYDAIQKHAVIRVADTGIGIDASIVSRIFQPFVQADTSLDRSRGGLGLGLALSKGLVEMHGGSIGVESDGLGKGSEFTVILPLEDIVTNLNQSTSQDIAHSIHRLLIIEDSIDMADTLRELLEFKDYIVEVAYNGLEGLEKAWKFHPDVVLCDIGLPDMNGYEVARAFRGDDVLKDTFLIAISGYAMPKDLQKAAAAGFDRHLAKPVELDAIERIIAQIPAKDLK